MNRTLILLVSVLALAALAFFVTKDGDNEKITTVVGADRDFSVDSASVYKVFIADRHGNKTTLERVESGWMYNKDYKARPDAVNNLLQAIHQVQMKFMPANAAIPHMVENLSTEGLKVEIYGKDGTQLKSYYIGGSTNDERGTFIIMDGAEQPYVASLPAWEGNIRFRYNLLGDDWRDRTLFKARPEEISAVSVEYPKQQNKSFRLVIEDEPELGPFYPLTPKISGIVKPGVIERFLNGFKHIQATSFGNKMRIKEETSKQIPFVIISLTKKTGEQYSLKLYPDHKEPTTDPKTGVVTYPEEVEAYFGLMDTGDFVSVQNRVVEGVLWSYPFFY